MRIKIIFIILIILSVVGGFYGGRIYENTNIKNKIVASANKIKNQLNKSIDQYKKELNLQEQKQHDEEGKTKAEENSKREFEEKFHNSNVEIKCENNVYPYDCNSKETRYGVEERTRIQYEKQNPKAYNIKVSCTSGNNYTCSASGEEESSE